MEGSWCSSLRAAVVVEKGRRGGRGTTTWPKEGIVYVAIVTIVIITIATTMIINIDDQAGKEKEKGGRRPRGA